MHWLKLLRQGHAACDCYDLLPNKISSCKPDSFVVVSNPGCPRQMLFRNINTLKTLSLKDLRLSEEMESPCPISILISMN